MLLWFNVFGAIGIKSYRFSVLANITCAETKVTWAVFKDRLKNSALGSYDIDTYFPVETK